MVEATVLFRDLSLLLSVAVASHFVFRRFKQSTILGEIALGILLGPSVLGFFTPFQFDETVITTFAALGAIFLLFLIGLESDFRALYTRKNIFVAFGGVVLPLVFGFLTALVMVPDSVIGLNGERFTMALFVGATLTATSTAIAASILLELNLMREDIAKTIMGAAVVDDVLGLLVLSIVVGMSKGSVNPGDIVLVMVVAVVFIVVAIAVGTYVLGPLADRMQAAGERTGLKHGAFVFALAMAFLYSFVAEVIGLSAIVGAFLAGSTFSATRVRRDFTEGAGYLGAVFTPIFFISLGLQVQLQHVAATGLTLLGFALVLIVVAVGTKVVGCYVPSRLQRMTHREAIAVGWGMVPRGEVGLIIAATALATGVIADGLFSVIVLVLIVVSVVPAPLFRRALKAVRRDRERAGTVSGPGS